MSLETDVSAVVSGYVDNLIVKGLGDRIDAAVAAHPVTLEGVTADEVKGIVEENTADVIAAQQVTDGKVDALVAKVAAIPAPATVDLTPVTTKLDGISAKIDKIPTTNTAAVDLSPVTTKLDTIDGRVGQVINHQLGNQADLLNAIGSSTSAVQAGVSYVGGRVSEVKDAVAAISDQIKNLPTSGSGSSGSVDLTAVNTKLDAILAQLKGMNRKKVAKLWLNMGSAASNAWLIDGVEGTNYFFPSKDFLKKYADMGVKKLRFPFSIERILVGQGSSLEATDATKAYLAGIRAVLDNAQALGMKVMIECHSYGRYWVKVNAQTNTKYEVQSYNGKMYEQRVINFDTCPINNDGVANMWLRLASAFKDHPALEGYGLMNEPYDGNDGFGVNANWPTMAQKCIDQIRTRDTVRPIYVCGGQFASCINFQKYSVETGLINITDPYKNLVFEGHLYFDENAGGFYGTANDKLDKFDPNIGVQRAKGMVEICKAKGLKCFVGEVGWPYWSKSSDLAARRMFRYLADNDVEVAYWFAGAFSGDNPLSLSRDLNGVYQNDPQVELLKLYWTRMKEEEAYQAAEDYTL